MSNILNIDLNMKTITGATAFHLACIYDQVNNVGMMINIENEYPLDLTVEDNLGRNGFELAKLNRFYEVVKLIMTKCPSISK